MSNTKEIKITIDDGKIRVPINNTSGDEIGVFYFRPTDINIIKRYNEVADKIDTITEPIEGIDAGLDDDSTNTALAESEKRLCEMIDYLFDGNASEAFFGKMNPFSPVNGQFYFELAFNAVGDFIAEQFDAETKKVNARVGKYTKKYEGKK